jgi:phosphoglucosamine mutase
VCRLFTPVPQLLRNVRFAHGRPLEDKRVQRAVAAAEQRLSGASRLLIRKSGTEPVVRVMAECEDATLLGEVIDGICAEILAVTRGADDGEPELESPAPVLGRVRAAE